MIDRISALRPAPSRAQARPQEDIGPRETFQRGDNPGEVAWGQSLTGDIRYHQVESKILDNSRGVWVYLPPGYHDNKDKHYPVLYMNDGQNVFEKGSAFGGVEWQADEAAERLMRQGLMDDVIIVAVSNSGAGRMDEYTPVPDPEHGGGQAAQYARFLTEELKPMIDSRYRTRTEAESTGVMGSSLGGLVSLYLAFQHPDVFGVCGALSPSLWWANQDMLKEISQLPAGQGPSKVWMDMGTKESPSDKDGNGVPDVLDHTRAMKGLLEGRGYQEGKNLFYWEVPGAGHNEYSWSQRMGDVFQALYPRQTFTVTGAP